MAARPALRVVRARAQPQDAAALKDALKEAEKAADGERAAAWDNVEEISSAIAHKKDQEAQALSDPLEAYCGDNPAADECRVYDD